MAILAQTGRVVIAESIALRPLHLAWGEGDGAWIEPPAEDAGATGLINELGRRTVTQVQYVIPDEEGEIELPGGNYTLSESPTNHLLITTVFDFGDASSDTIREIGLFAGTETGEGLPGGQKYFIPSEVTNPGRLLHIENVGPIFRSVVIKETFKIVITF